ncbi:GNAT family N-acetyltransferase [Actinomadura barringtoniae]|uniref:GNAT family N-acetyltransferase n=1 Tax=Actinomadura barringtoniae TaxID=1427535 RepID=A0A939PCF6_9ACTN|nr:GNAT family N-acetyltransferase [Actinomadura barringtoniae]MBO2450060.1 GNAT family N-acetyltransferase [Actinomadura barringtoniae]
MSDVLRTGRLALHPVSMSDHSALLAHWTGPKVRRHLFEGVALSPTQVTEVIASSQRDFATEGYGLWGLRDAGTALDHALPDGDLIGVAGLRGHGADVEIVYSLQPDRWGQGLAAEAGRAVLEYAFEVLRLRRVTAEIDAGLADVLGMRPHGDGHYAAERSAWFGSRHTVDV